MLLQIAGKPLIIHTLERTLTARSVHRVVVATDDDRIRDAVTAAGCEVVMTSSGHRSGSDRIAEAAAAFPDTSVIVNVQGDEPVISPETIDRVVTAMDEPSIDIATASEPIHSVGELLNGNNVKVVTGEDGQAIYFSRSPMPFPREASLRYNGDPGQALKNEPELFSNYRKHTGIYAYRRDYLLKFTKLPPTRLEQFEGLEQLRALENGALIKVVEAAAPSIGVDTRADLEQVRRMLETPGINYREATKDDIPDVARVHVKSWQRSFEGIVPKQFLDSMSIERRIKAFGERFDDDESFYEMLVAEDKEKRIIGFADFGDSRHSNGYDAELYAIYFLPEYQRKGIGSHLFKMCQLRMAARGSNSMCLDSLEVSPFGNFYEKLGGKIIGAGFHDLAGEEFKTVVYGWKDLSEFR